MRISYQCPKGGCFGEVGVYLVGRHLRIREDEKFTASADNVCTHGHVLTTPERKVLEAKAIEARP